MKKSIGIVFAIIAMLGFCFICTTFAQAGLAGQIAGFIGVCVCICGFFASVRLAVRQ